MIIGLVTAISAVQKSATEINPGGQWLWAIIAALLFGVAISLNVVAASLFLLFAFALRWRAIVLILSAAFPLLCGRVPGFRRSRPGIR